jgi:hypothetical protein
LKCILKGIGFLKKSRLILLYNTLGEVHFIFLSYLLMSGNEIGSSRLEFFSVLDSNT